MTVDADHRLLSEHTTDIVMRVRLDGVIEWVSPVIQEVLGFSPDQWVGRSTLDMVHPDFREELATQMQRVATTGEDARFEFPVIDADGASVWMESAGRLGNDSDGTQFRVVRLRNVNDSHEIQRQLAESEEMFRHAMMNAPIGMCLIAPDGSFLGVNPALCALLDRDEPTLLRTTWQEMTHPDDLEADLTLVADVIDGKRDTYRLAKRYLRPNGDVVWGDLSVSAVRTTDGRVRFFISQIVDVTAARQADQAAREATALLERSQSEYRMLAENASDVVFLAGPDRCVRWVSPSVTRSLGWTPDELVGTAMADLWRPEALAATERDRAAVYSGADPTPANGYLFELRARDGTYHWVAGRATPLVDDDGSPAGVVSGMKIVDDLVEAQRDLEAQRANLQAVLDSELDARVWLHPVRDGSGMIIDFTYGDANPAALEYLRRPASDLVGAQMLHLFPKQATGGLFQRYVETVESGTPLILSAAPFDSEISAETRRFDFRGVVVNGGLSLTWRDVTSEYRNQQVLRESEEHFRLLAENAADVVLLARDGILQWLSPSLNRVLGWLPEDWVGHRFEDFTHPDDIALAQARRDEINAGSARVTRLRLRSGEGDYHWVEVRAAPFTDAAGESNGIMASFHLVDDQMQAEAELAHQAHHDHLTGLLNRAEAYKKLESMRAHPQLPGTRILLAFADLDNLKEVNDANGHLAGDELLRVVAERVSVGLRANDLVARMGGDEFLIVLTGVPHTADGPALIERLMAGVNIPHDMGTYALHPRMSIGLTELTPGEDIEQAVRRADSAMYEAKKAGGNRIKVGA